VELDAKQGTPVPVPDEDYTTELRYDAVGVAACIVPWNYPMLMATWKIAPCLAAGCTCVIKPSELSPLTLLLFASICADCGLPPGVLNVLVGSGRVGAAMAAHPMADKVAFTGSGPVGEAVMRAAAPTIKNVSLELGGKSAIIVFDDADVERAVEWVMFGCFWTNGQICSSTSRLLVHADMEAQFLQRLVQCSRSIPILAPLAEGNEEATGALGPLVAKRQLDKVSRLVAEAVADGAQLLTGGRRPPHLGRGFFYEPTVLKVKPSRHEIWTTEVFGPVLTVATFTSEAEAVRLANETNFGLAAAVCSADQARCSRVASALQAGIVWVNCSQPCFADAPWGGYKRSGVGRELGEFGLMNFLEVKQVTKYVADKPLGWYSMPPPRSKL
jgi:betaine-aldehyde dehydrogenase